MNVTSRLSLKKSSRRCHLPLDDDVASSSASSYTKQLRNGDDDYDDDSIRQHSEVDKGSKVQQERMNCVQI